MKQEQKEQPVKKFVDYPVSVTIWKKDIEVESGKKTINVTVYNSTVMTTYKDKEDEYKNSSNFKDIELLKTIQLCSKAYNWIVEQKQKDHETKE